MWCVYLAVIWCGGEVGSDGFLSASWAYQQSYRTQNHTIQHYLLMNKDNEYVFISWYLQGFMFNPPLMLRMDIRSSKYKLISINYLRILNSKV